MRSHEGPTSGDLAPGRHDAVVVDARWDTGADPSVLWLSLTLIGGALRGEVIEVAFELGSAALGRALSSLGIGVPEAGTTDDGGDRDVVTAGALGMPCTLVIARDPAGHLGYALEP